jgi:hypothetical protein
VAFVELAPVASTMMVPPAIAAAIGGRGGGSGSLPELAENLQDSHALLILDNAEHLDELDGVVEELLSRCRLLRIVATSRTPLGVAGEQVYPVAPLDEEAAVALIIDRARAHRPGFEASEDESRQLRELAQRLACLPLALELAAARLRLLSPTGLLDRVDRQLDLLRDSGSSLPSRQRTMRAAIDWSYRLLTTEDADVLRSLAAFVAPATLRSIAYVSELDELDALDALGRLADASLIAVSGDVDPRYGMLEPIRQFAAERLGDDEVAASHAADRLIGWYESQVLDRPMFLGEASSIVSDVHNYGEALEATIDRGESTRWVRLVYPITRAFSSSRTLHERLAGWFARVDPEILTPQDRVRLAFIRATTTGWLDRALWGEVASLARPLGDTENERFALLSIANSYLGDNRVDDAAATLADADALTTSAPMLDAFSATLAAQLAEFRADPDADAVWERASVISRSTGDPSNALPTLDAWAYGLLGRGEFQRARQLVDEVREIASVGVKDASLVYMSSCQRAIAYLACGAADVALESILDALALDDELNMMNRTIPTPMLLLVSSAALGVGGRPEAALTISEVARRNLHDYYDISDERVAAQLEPFIDSAAAALPADRRDAAIAAANALDEADAVRLAIDEAGIALRDVRAGAKAGRV